MPRDIHRKIYLTGAAGAGVTTLGAEIARHYGLTHIDCDTYYWQPTDPPYTHKRPVAERCALISARQAQGGWVLSGAFDGWGDPLIGDVDLVVYLQTPTPLRIARIRAREAERYGARIEPGGDMHGIHRAFIAWAAEYDNPRFAGRNRRRHEEWLAVQQAPVLRLEGDSPLPALLWQVTQSMMTELRPATGFGATAARRVATSQA
ncbi:adenylate kinase [Phaeovulum sp. W22_SRMD_FR3]|uniref:adenylate kinase n=1 Tax=Phaeovulum sp. W22_SRMD_FR3 TaxID=3240274 RepID=UPI003F94875F